MVGTGGWQRGGDLACQLCGPRTSIDAWNALHFVSVSLPWISSGAAARSIGAGHLRWCGYLADTLIWQRTDKIRLSTRGASRGVSGACNENAPLRGKTGWTLV